MMRTQVIMGLQSLHNVARSRRDLIDAKGLTAVVDQFSDLRQREAAKNETPPDSEWQPLGAVVNRIITAAGLPGIVAVH